MKIGQENLGSVEKAFGGGVLARITISTLKLNHIHKPTSYTGLNPEGAKTYAHAISPCKSPAVGEYEFRVV